MAYCTTQDVAALCGNLIGGGADFSATTVPTQAQVGRWLSSGCAIINSRLKARGFTPPSSGTDLYDMLMELNALFGAAKAETARTNVRLSLGERTRGQVLMKDFTDGLTAFLAGDLSRAGLAYQNAGYVGGISKFDKSSVASNTDREEDRFKKDQFMNPGVSRANVQERIDEIR